MKRILASFILIAVAVSLSGCYYDPGYSYVRGSAYRGDAYYGQGATTYYAAPGYYDGYYPGYYGDGYYGYYGCCYTPGVSVGIGGAWYGGSRYHGHDRDDRGYRRDRDGGYHDDRRGGYRGDVRQSSGVRAQARPSTPGGGRRGGDHRRDRAHDHRN
jgi:hypothetical protein